MDPRAGRICFYRREHAPSTVRCGLSSSAGIPALPTTTILMLSRPRRDRPTDPDALLSAKFEVEDGKLQLSIYTMKPGDFTEVIVAPDSGSVKSAEKITDAEDLKAATSQKAAMDKTTLSLAAVTGQTAQEAAGSRAISIFPELRNGHPVAVITMLRDDKFMKIVKTLD
jgi:hypothetical protein